MKKAKRIANHVALTMIGFIAAHTVTNTIGIGFTISLAVAVLTVYFINESEAK